MGRSLGIVLGGLAVVALLSGIGQAEPVKVGGKAPDFTATNVDGKTITLGDLKGADAVVLCFTCNECPVAKAYEDRFTAFVKKYSGKNVKFVALNCNTSTENLDAMKKHAEERNFNYPYAFDQTGASAPAYGAKVTPHLFVIDGKGTVVYIGSFDDHMNKDKVTKNYVVDAVDAVLAGKTPAVTATRAFGCTIKQ